MFLLLLVQVVVFFPELIPGDRFSSSIPFAHPCGICYQRTLGVTW